MCWSLNGNGKVDTRSFYNELRTTPKSIFPWKGIWKEKVPKRVAFFFLWTATHDHILTLDNLILRGHPLANRCCMCRCSGESMHHLFIHCHVVNSLWVFMLQVFGIQWVLPSSVAELLFCWNHWLGKHDSDIWNLISGCLMWTVWMERNHRSFEDSEKYLVELIGLCQRSLFDWSQCWGFTECSSIVQFFSSLSLVS